MSDYRDMSSKDEVLELAWEAYCHRRETMGEAGVEVPKWEELSDKSKAGHIASARFLIEETMKRLNVEKRRD